MMPSYGGPDAHRIRLRGPWEFEWLKAPAGLPEDRRTGRLTLPATWAEAFGFAPGTVRLYRRFGRPAEPDPDERAWLEIAAPEGVLSASLNGDWLGTLAAGVVRFDVTDRLAWRNRLDLEVTTEEAPASPGPVVTVALVFEPTEGFDEAT